jgi:hypothetical protein
MSDGEYTADLFEREMRGNLETLTAAMHAVAASAE